MTTREGKALKFVSVSADYAGGIQEGDETPVLITNQSGGVVGEFVEYVALFTQSGTAAPALSRVYRNDLGVTPTASRSGAGVYALVFSTGPWNASDTTVTVTNLQNSSTPKIFNASTVSNIVTINSFSDATTPADTWSALVQIRKYL